MNRIAIVTGGSGALGRVVVSALAADGYAVARVDHGKAAASDPGVLDIGGVDLTDAGAAAGAVAKAVETFGGVDVLVNIAGGFTWQTTAEGDPAAWGRMQAINLTTAVTMTRAALPELLKRPGARIVNIGAGAAIAAGAGMGAYAASKAGVHRLTESLAAELIAQDITVNALLPSIIDTPANRRDMPEADTSTWVSPQAVAEVILFLGGAGSRAVSGALIPVTRGG